VAGPLPRRTIPFYFVALANISRIKITHCRPLCPRDPLHRVRVTILGESVILQTPISPQRREAALGAQSP
jgi:hypothetical protein